MRLLAASQLEPGEVYKYIPLASRIVRTYIVVSVQKIENAGPKTTRIFVIASLGKVIWADIEDRECWLPVRFP